MKKILNVGCGNDTYGTHFVDAFPNRPEVKKCNVDEEKLPFPNNYFDEVYSKNIFEHLINPGLVLKEMYRVLRKNGKLVLLTDNANSWWYSVGGVHLGGYEKIKEKEGVYEDRHYSLFTDWHLRNYAQKIGFKKIKVSYLDGNLTLHKNLIKFVNFVLTKTLFWRMGHNMLKLEARK